jgi:hypothetical protein
MQQFRLLATIINADEGPQDAVRFESNQSRVNASH